jgi:DNA-damage-inducible protein D
MLIHYNEIVPQGILDFLEAIYSRDIKYYASEFLDEFEIEDEMIEIAIKRAINACSSLNIPYYIHFRKIYIAEHSVIYTDWKLSSLGCYLTVVNCDPSNPLIAKFQTSLFAV